MLLLVLLVMAGVLRQCCGCAGGGGERCEVGGREWELVEVLCWVICCCTLCIRCIERRKGRLLNILTTSRPHQTWEGAFIVPCAQTGKEGAGSGGAYERVLMRAMPRRTQLTARPHGPTMHAHSR